MNNFEKIKQASEISNRQKIKNNTVNNVRNEIFSSAIEIETANDELIKLLEIQVSPDAMKQLKQYFESNYYNIGKILGCIDHL